MGIAHAVKKLDVFFEKSLHACKLPKDFVTRRVSLFVIHKTRDIVYKTKKAAHPVKGKRQEVKI